MSAAIGLNIAPSIWEWLLSIGGVKLLSDKQHLDVDRWKAGSGQPSVKDIDALSRKMHVPFGYFFLTEPLDDTPSVFAHRAMGSLPMYDKPSRALVDTIREMETLQDWAVQDSIVTDGAIVDFAGSLNVSSSMDVLVTAVREYLCIDEHWQHQPEMSNPAKAFNFIRAQAQSGGIIVMMNGIVGQNTRRKLDPQEFRAFALVNRRAPLVFINRADEPAAARLFSLLHEIVHVGMGQDELFNADESSGKVSMVERVCNEVTSELLMPDSDFKRLWAVSEGTWEQRLASVRKCFPVSRSTVALRALSHGYLTQEQYADTLAAAREWTAVHEQESHGGDYYLTKKSRFDQRLLDHIAASVGRGDTSYVEAYRLTGTTRKTFPNLLQEAGI